MGCIGGGSGWLWDDGRGHRFNGAIIEEDDILWRCGQVHGDVHARPDDHIVARTGLSDLSTRRVRFPGGGSVVTTEGNAYITVINNSRINI